MTAQGLFIIGMITALGTALTWLLSGGAHRSAHPNGERPQLVIIWPWTGPREGITYFRDDAFPRCIIDIGVQPYHQAWGVGIVWGLIEPTPPPMYWRYRHSAIIARRHFRRPRNLWTIGYQ